ncbi:MAG TPA: polysaccharide pyruvyl transferase family protein [Candidatus Sulfotelmatobacter sp.]|jgi:polysaccharide pyruvyl transferase WcaK-like protein|nr:polysaccharide pyruvyl transferase family protein [Candidatus Sulfotelmatobacter sp.]
MDLVLQAWTSSLIELSGALWKLGAGRPWQPGEKLKLLYAGYNGARNTGSDVRVEEMLRQARRVLGAENLELSVMSQDFNASRGYFGDARQVFLPDIYPPFLFREVRKHHGVVACEGSMFKSKFADALTTMFIGALGIASAENKLSVGYGAEAGFMNPLLEQMCARYCKRSLIITRNEESQAVLSKLGIASELGTDTAWTFEPHPPEYGSKALADAGWDGKTPILAVCPINPFWWPVTPSTPKFLAHSLFGAYKDSYYRTIYFHKSGADVDAAYKKYLVALATGVKAFCSRHRVFLVLIAMEKLDTRACQALAPELGGAPVFSSESLDMYKLVSILRCASLILSSRFHAIVTSMPSLVPSAGVTMDERIRNLMRERGHDRLLLTVDDPDLGEKLVDVMEYLAANADAIREGIGSSVVRNLKTMARMGVFLERAIHQQYPEFPVRSGVHGWEEYLPPLSANLERVLESYSSAAAAAAGN